MVVAAAQFGRCASALTGVLVVMQSGAALHAELLFRAHLGPADVALHEVEPMGTRAVGTGTTSSGIARDRSAGRRMLPMTGRFAPSPTGSLHVGNLRTALIAWLCARVHGDRFVLRMEDLDRVAASADHEHDQQDDLRALGIDWDGVVWRQSERFDVYDAAIDRLAQTGRTYECFCSRREIREAASAPHGAETLVYPGICRQLTEPERAERRRRRHPAIRFRGDDELFEVDDVVAGVCAGRAADVVLRRNDGVPAYNLAVVVDDHEQGVDQVVRGDDLLATTPSQVAVARALGFCEPRYAHVPLVVGESGRRLAKRDGAITLADLRIGGFDADLLRSKLAVSIGIAEPGEMVSIDDLAARFDLDRFARRPARPVTLRNLLA